jgi:hypothetical protein
LSTPAVSPAPPDRANGLLGEEGEQKTFETVDLPLPGLEDEDGYHTDDDLSELEGGELEESLKRQREDESQDVFHTLMRDVSQKEWKKAESKRSMGYGNKSSDRTERWRRQKEREKKMKDAEVKQDNYSPPVPRKSAHMMRDFFKLMTVKDFEPETPEEEDPVPKNLDGVAETGQAMEYESDT